MRQPNIILTGFMGTGKSTVGRLIADKSSRSFIDTDELIIKQSGLTVSEIFSKKGEGHFRKLERQIAYDLENVDSSVIATGGRMLLDPLNALLLSSMGLIFCLTAPPEEIFQRLKFAGERPLLKGSDPREQIDLLLKSRESAYQQFQQVHTGDAAPEEVASEIIEKADELIRHGRWPQQLLSKLDVQHPSGQYPILIGHEILPTFRQQLSIDDSIVIITDDHIEPLYRNLINSLKPLNIITIPAGERNKNLETLIPIYSQLLESGLDRSGTIVGLGGGVVGDIAGFLAATYMRGVSLVQCPTTLLAMVDASIGGKTGVDLAQGKNLVGAFKQPEAVVADLSTLKSLPKDEIVAGMAEIIKHGLIASPILLKRVQSGASDNYAKNSDNRLQVMVVEAIMVKRQIVQEDPFERGIRAHLNLGHTFAHAIETLSHYQIKHGFAVAMGLVAAAHLSAKLGHCDPELVRTIEKLLAAVGLPTRIPAEFDPDELLQLMKSDKKRASGKVYYVLIRSVGEVFVTSNVPQNTVAAAISSLQGTETY